MTLATGSFAVLGDAAQLRQEAQQALALLDGLYALMRTAVSVGPGHPSARAAAQQLAETLRPLGYPLGLQFLGASAYCNRLLLPVDIDRVAQAVAVARALDQIGAQELFLEKAPSAEALMALVQVLVRAPGGEGGAVAAVEGISWRQLTGPVWGDGAKPVDRDVAGRVWLARATTLADQIDRDETTAWPWAQSAAILRRLEQTLLLDSGVALRALELAPGPWSPGRRALAVALRTMLMLHHVRAALETQRVAGHVAFLAAIHGFLPQSLRSFDLAAQSALLRAAKEPGVDLVVSARHRLAVAALLQAMAQRAGTGSTWPGPLGAVLVSWDLEARRGGSGELAPMSLVEAISAAEVDPYLAGGRPWLLALVAAVGVVPPGCVAVDGANLWCAVLDASGRSGNGQPMLVTARQVVPGQAPLTPLLRGG